MHRVELCRHGAQNKESRAELIAREIRSQHMRLAWVEGEVGISTRQRAVLHVLQRQCLLAINSNAVEGGSQLRC